MSDLQIALAGIGIVVIGLVYAYNLWQERRLRKTLDRAFAAPDADVLLDPADGRVEPVFNRPGSPGEGSQSDALPDSGEGLPAEESIRRTGELLEQAAMKLAQEWLLD